MVTFAFELLNRSLVTEASMAGIKLTRIEFLAILIPAATSYQYLRFAALARDLGAYHSVFYLITNGKFSGLWSSDLDRMILHLGGPTTTQLPAVYAPHQRRLAVGASLTELTLYNILPLLFAGYAFWQLFSAHGPSDPLVWLSLIVSIFLLSVGWSYAAMGVRMISAPQGKRDADDWVSAFRRPKEEIADSAES